MARCLTTGARVHGARGVFLLGAMVVAATPAWGQEPLPVAAAAAAAAPSSRAEGGARGALRVRAVRAGVRAVVVDGRLDEHAWAGAAAADGFVQQRPEPGRAAAQRTEARVLYDDAALYVGMRLHDSAPDSIAAPLGRRDYSGYSDWAHVIIDSYFDRRTAFRFAVNPSGVKRDAFLSGDNEWGEDASWDAVWDAAVARDSLGWTAELRIPLTQLRFSSNGGRRDGGRGMKSRPGRPDSARDGLTWGVQFARDVARRDERSYWAPVAPDAGGFVSLFGTLEGLSGLAAPRRLEVAPYTVARLTRSPVDAGDPLHRRTTPAGSAGADLKYGLTSDLTLTATLLPDFGQVEADPSQVNLSGLELFFDERRPFFVEGGDLFRFGLSMSGWAFGPEQLFYSRRVGRAPQGSVPDGARFSDAPNAATLLGAVKLSGKTAGGWSVGALSAVTAPEEARYVSPAGARAAVPVEPLTGYTVGRVIKDLRGGRSAVGGVVTAVNRRLEGDALDFLRGSAYAGGVDWRHRFGRDDNYTLTGSLVGSQVRGTAAAIAETQRSATHFFQRPDAAPRLGVDSTRTSLSGLSSELRVVKQGGGSWRWGAVGHVVTPGFEVNDAGFGNRTDYGSLTGWLGYVRFRPTRAARSWELWNNHWSGWTLGGEQLKNGANLFGRAQLHNYWETYAELWHDRPSLSVTALRGGPALYLPGHAGAWTRVVLDARRRAYVELIGFRDVELGTGGRRTSLRPVLNVRASSRSELSLQPAVTRSTDQAQYVATHDTLGSTRYVAGRLEQTTASLTARVGYTFTPALSFQLYAQPFVSGGRYTAFREVRAPSARRFADRFRTLAPAELSRAGGRLSVDDDGDGATDYGFNDPSFNVRELRSNAVLRWEYRPGSALFVVWSQSRDGGGVDDVRGGPGAFHLRDDARRLFGARATNVLLVKVSYWMNPG